MKKLLISTTLGILSIPVWSAETPTVNEEEHRPNILLIVSEDHGPELGCYGDPIARTPAFDRLAAEGMRFEHAHVVQAGCSPSRAAIHTGLYAHQNGQIGLATWGFRLYNEDIPNLPRSLKEAGYRTGIIGKLHINPESAFPFDFKAMPSGNFARKDLAGYARHAGEFMAKGNGPFFLAVNYPDAHSPWQRQVDGLPAEPIDPEDVEMLPYYGVDTPELREVLANHYNSIMRLDSLVGELLDTLKAHGKADNTLVIFISDHGPDIIRGKRTVYEGGTRVPLIIRWPAGVDAGQVSRALVESTDLMPTLLEVSGAQPVPGLPGKSLLPILKGEPVEWRRFLFTEYHTHATAPNFNPQRAVRDNRYKLIHNLYPGEVNRNFTFTFNKDRYGYDSAAKAAEEAPEHIRETYRRMRIQPRFELYDLYADPNEFHNLADNPAYADVFEELSGALTVLREQSGDPLLDPDILNQFRGEILNLTEKRTARRHDYQYPSYFFPEKKGKK
jgi:N-sulfoglucosamine sulfohydrolase